MSLFSKFKTPKFLQQVHEAPLYSIVVGNSPLKDTIGVLSITVNKAINKIPYAKLELSDGDVAKQDFKVSSSEEFKQGTEVKIYLGSAAVGEPAARGPGRLAVWPVRCRLSGRVFRLPGHAHRGGTPGLR